MVTLVRFGKADAKICGSQVVENCLLSTLPSPYLLTFHFSCFAQNSAMNSVKPNLSYNLVVAGSLQFIAFRVAKHLSGPA